MFAYAYMHVFAVLSARTGAIDAFQVACMSRLCRMAARQTAAKPGKAKDGSGACG